MSHTNQRLLVTGASGQLGSRVVQFLLTQCPASQIVATARDPHRLAGLAAKGVTTRCLDYTNPTSIREACQDVERLLLISSSALGQRINQHRAVIDAAKQVGIQLFVYTSVLGATSIHHPLLRDEHGQTEALIRQSGLPYVLLRNGWYTENYTAGIPQAVTQGEVLGCAGQGRISGASRDDYALAAARVLASSQPQAGSVYELAGDSAFTLDQFAAEVSRQANKTVVYRNLSEADYIARLQQVGLPPEIAEFVAQSDTAAAHGSLFNDSKTLHTLIQRPTTSLKDLVAAALATTNADRT